MVEKYTIESKNKFHAFHSFAISGRSALYLVMRHAVVVEIAGGSEPLSANATLVGLLAAVDPPEIHEILSTLDPLISLLERGNLVMVILGTRN